MKTTPPIMKSAGGALWRALPHPVRMSRVLAIVTANELAALIAGSDEEQVWLEQCIIVGRVSFQGQHIAPRVVFHQCTFTDEVDATNSAWGGGLVLRGSIFREGIGLAAALIHGQFDIVGCSFPLPESQRFEPLQNARLNEPPDRQRSMWWPGLHVEGQLLGDAAFFGGSLCLDGARIEGSLFLQGVVVGGDPVRKRGRLFLRQARVDGDLNLSPSQLRESLSRPRRSQVHGSIEFSSAIIAGSVYLNGIFVFGCVDGQLADVAGDVDASVAVLETKASAEEKAIPLHMRTMVKGRLGAAIRLSDARVRNSVRLDGALMGGQLNLRDVKIEGNLYCRQIAHVEEADPRTGNLSLKFLRFQEVLKPRILAPAATCMGDDINMVEIRRYEEAILLTGASIKGSVEFDGVRIHGAISAENIKVGGDFTMVRAEVSNIDPSGHVATSIHLATTLATAGLKEVMPWSGAGVHERLITELMTLCDSVLDYRLKTADQQAKLATQVWDILTFAQCTAAKLESDPEGYKLLGQMAILGAENLTEYLNKSDLFEENEELLRKAFEVLIRLEKKPSIWVLLRAAKDLRATGARPVLRQLMLQLLHASSTFECPKEENFQHKTLHQAVNKINESGVLLDIADGTIGLSLDLSGIHLSGSVRMHGVKVGGDLLFSPWIQGTPLREKTLSHARRTRPATGTAESPPMPAVVRGLMDLSWATVQGSVDMRALVLSGDLRAEGVTFKGSTEFTACVVLGSIKLEDAKVAGELSFGNDRIRDAAQWKTYLAKAGTFIGGKIDMRRLDLQGDCVFNYTSIGDASIAWRAHEAACWLASIQRAAENHPDPYFVADARKIRPTLKLTPWDRPQTRLPRCPNAFAVLDLQMAKIKGHLLLGGPKLAKNPRSEGGQKTVSNQDLVNVWCHGTLEANGLEVSGMTELLNSTFFGSVRLDNSHLREQLDFSNSLACDNLSLAHATVEGSTFFYHEKSWRAPEKEEDKKRNDHVLAELPECTDDFFGSILQVRTLWHEWQCPRVYGKLRLDGARVRHLNMWLFPRSPENVYSFRKNLETLSLALMGVRSPSVVHLNTTQIGNLTVGGCLMPERNPFIELRDFTFAELNAKQMRDSPQIALMAAELQPSNLLRLIFRFKYFCALCARKIHAFLWAQPLLHTSSYVAFLEKMPLEKVDRGVYVQVENWLRQHGDDEMADDVYLAMRRSLLSSGFWRLAMQVGVALVDCVRTTWALFPCVPRLGVLVAGWLLRRLMVFVGRKVPENTKRLREIRVACRDIVDKASRRSVDSLHNLCRLNGEPREMARSLPGLLGDSAWAVFMRFVHCLASGTTRWPQKLLLMLVGSGVRKRRLAFLLCGVFLYSWLSVFSCASSVERKPAFVANPTDGLSASQINRYFENIVIQPNEEEWTIWDGWWVALREHVPPLQILVHGEWVPAEVRGDHYSLAKFAKTLLLAHRLPNKNECRAKFFCDYATWASWMRILSSLGIPLLAFSVADYIKKR